MDVAFSAKAISIRLIYYVLFAYACITNEKDTSDAVRLLNAEFKTNSDSC